MKLDHELPNFFLQLFYKNGRLDDWEFFTKQNGTNSLPQIYQQQTLPQLQVFPFYTNEMKLF